MSESPNQCRVTPDDLFGLLNREFRFDVDAAADESNTKCEEFICAEMDALHPDTAWVLDYTPVRGPGGELVKGTFSIFCNPPWSDPAPWLEKAYTEAQKSPNAVVVVVLHQTWSAGVAPWLLKATEIRQLLNPRPMFKIPNGWYKCDECKQCFTDLLWPTPIACSPCCASKATPQKNSSNSKDVQIIIYRRKLHDTPPLVWFWDWRREIAL